MVDEPFLPHVNRLIWQWKVKAWLAFLMSFGGLLLSFTGFWVEMEDYGPADYMMMSVGLIWFSGTVIIGFTGRWCHRKLERIRESYIRGLKDPENAEFYLQQIKDL